MKPLIRAVDSALALVLVLWLALPSVPGLGPSGTVLRSGFDVLAGWGYPAAALVPWGLLLLQLAAWVTPARWDRFFGPGSWPLAVARLVAATLVLAVLAVAALTEGTRSAWFAALGPLFWLSMAAAAAVLGLGTGLGLRRITFPSQPAAPEVGGRASLVDSARARLFRIRAKLLSSFMALIASVVLILSTLLLSNYETSLFQAVSDGARAQVLQATSVYKANLGAESDIAMFDFLRAQNRINAGASFPYRSFGFYSDLTSRYWTDRPDRAPFPSLRVEYASDQPDLRHPAVPPLDAEEGLKLWESSQTGGRKTAGTVSFAAPILQAEFEKNPDGSKVRHERLIGLAVLTFDEDVILAPYLKTRTMVVLLTLLFLYVASVLVYLVGSRIVTPLLHLRSNVRLVSANLESMVDGRRRISASNLTFNPAVRSRDEIQHLSSEIHNMVTVIRGILPYISASTLRQSGQEAPSETKHLTFLFTDIRGFTTLCEGMPPNEVVGMLNRYLDLETEIILANHGDIDKFVGDEVMAFFDGPDQEANACRAALQIRKAMYDEKTLRQERGLPSVEIGIGIHAGEVVFGSVGARDRRDFTSIGDPVNLAARLEGANKAYGTKSLLSESVFEKISGLFLCREIDALTVKGKAKPVRVFELLQEKKTASPRAQALATGFDAALKAYRLRDWTRAAELFRALSADYEDGPSTVFLHRAEAYAKAPPGDDWDGVFRMDRR